MEQDKGRIPTKRLGVLVMCGSKNVWNNTFEAMCENFYHDVDVGVQEVMLPAGYGLITERVDSMSQPVQKPQLLQKDDVDGYLLMGGMLSEEMVAMLKSSGRPIVIIGRDYEGVDCVTTDYRKATYVGVRHLLERGHRDILFINGPQRTPTSALKAAGYAQALEDFSMHPSPKRCVNSEFTGEGGYWATKIACEKGLRPTVIFAGSDTIAAGALAFLYEQRCHVPDDVSIMTFEHSILTEYLSPVLTSVNTNKEEIGRQAALMMLRRLEKPDKPVECVTVPFGLTYGASVKTL